MPSYWEGLPLSMFGVFLLYVLARVVFDLAGKKVARLCRASAPFGCNALRSLLALASLKVQIL